MASDSLFGCGSESLALITSPVCGCDARDAAANCWGSEDEMARARKTWGTLERISEDTRVVVVGGLGMSIVFSEKQ